MHSVAWRPSNPYRTAPDPSSSPGTTTYAYDALGRKTQETYPDNSVLKTAYCGPNTLVRFSERLASIGMSPASSAQIKTSPARVATTSIGLCTFVYEEPREAKPVVRAEAEDTTVSALSVFFPSNEVFVFYELREPLGKESLPGWSTI
jgi:YD repeat-containing protein